MEALKTADGAAMEDFNSNWDEESDTYMTVPLQDVESGRAAIASDR